MRTIIAWLSLFLTVLAFGKSITTNGTGGGNIASPSTWAGGLTFADGDAVTIATGDTLTNPVSTSATFGSLTCATPGNGTLQLYGTFVLNADTSTCNIVADGAAISGSGGFAIPTTSGATLSIHNSTCNTCGQIVLTGMAGNATFSLLDDSFTNSPGSTSYGFIVAVGWGAKTGGTREIQRTFFNGGTFTSTGYLDVGLVYKNNVAWCDGDSSTTHCLDMSLISFAAGNFDYNFCWQRAEGTNVSNAIKCYMPAGTVRHYALMPSSSVSDSSCDHSVHYNPYALYNDAVYGGSNGLTYNFEHFYMEPDCGAIANEGIILGPSDRTAIINISGTVSQAGTNVGGFNQGGLDLVVTQSTTACGGVDCHTVNADHNTLNGYAGALDFEGSGAFAGQLNATNNIWWNPSSQTCGAAVAGSSPGVDGTWVFDYNGDYNCSTAITAGLSTPTWATVTNQSHGTLGDPGFVNGSFNLLSWCKTLNPSDATWSDCAAHFAAHEAGYTPQDFFTAMSAAFVPTNSNYSNAGVGGTYLGAFPLSGGSTTQIVLTGTAKMKGTAKTKP